MYAGPGLPTFVNSYPPNAVQGGSAYLTPAGQGTCQHVPPGPFPQPGNSGCTEDVPDNGEGPDADGGIHGRPRPLPLTIHHARLCDSLKHSLFVSPGPPMLDLPVYKDAILKLQYAASNLKKTQQKFFLNVGIKRPCDSKPNALLWLRVSASACW